MPFRAAHVPSKMAMEADVGILDVALDQADVPTLAASLSTLAAEPR